jgi:hypothetical protein
VNHNPSLRQPKPLTPAARRALYLLKSREWVNGEELRSVAGSRYGARLDELKPHGYSWDKKRIRGTPVPYYRLVLPVQQLPLDLAS